MSLTGVNTQQVCVGIDSLVDEVVCPACTTFLISSNKCVSVVSSGK